MENEEYDDHVCRCRCGEEVDGNMHPCPFRQEIHGCDEECNCCADCQYQCAMDI